MKEKIVAPLLTSNFVPFQLDPSFGWGIAHEHVREFTVCIFKPKRNILKNSLAYYEAVNWNPHEKQFKTSKNTQYTVGFFFKTG